MTEPIDVDALVDKLDMVIDHMRDRGMVGASIVADAQDALRSRPAAPPAVPRQRCRTCGAPPEVGPDIAAPAQADEAQGSSPADRSNTIVQPDKGHVRPEDSVGSAGTNAELCARLHTPIGEVSGPSGNLSYKHLVREREPTDAEVGLKLFALSMDDARRIESLERQVAEIRGLLIALRSWDFMDASDAGFWRKRIDAALAKGSG